MNAILSITEIIGGLGTIVALISMVFELRRKAKEDKIDCASKISAWIRSDWPDYPEADIVICNSSAVPIYDVIFSIDQYSNSLESISKENTNCGYTTCIPPGKYIATVPFGGHVAGAKFGASISFRDHKGIYWTRLSGGELIEHSKIIALNGETYLNKVNHSSYEVRNFILPSGTTHIQPYQDH